MKWSLSCFVLIACTNGGALGIPTMYKITNDLYPRTTQAVAKPDCPPPPSPMAEVSPPAVAPVTAQAASSAMSSSGPIVVPIPQSTLGLDALDLYGESEAMLDLSAPEASDTTPPPPPALPPFLDSSSPSISDQFSGQLNGQECSDDEGSLVGPINQRFGKLPPPGNQGHNAVPVNGGTGTIGINLSAATSAQVTTSTGPQTPTVQPQHLYPEAGHGHPPNEAKAQASVIAAAGISASAAVSSSVGAKPAYVASPTHGDTGANGPSVSASAQTTAGVRTQSSSMQPHNEVSAAGHGQVPNEAQANASAAASAHVNTPAGASSTVTASVGVSASATASSSTGAKPACEESLVHGDLGASGSSANTSAHITAGVRTQSPPVQPHHEVSAAGHGQAPKQAQAQASVATSAQANTQSGASSPASGAVGVSASATASSSAVAKQVGQSSSNVAVGVSASAIEGQPDGSQFVGEASGMAYSMASQPTGAPAACEESDPMDIGALVSPIGL